MGHTTDTLNRELEQLFRQYSHQLFISALAVAGCPARAEDAVQEAFYRLFRLRHRPRRLKAYVFRSVRNAALDQLQRDKSVSIEDDEYIFDADQGPGQTAQKNEFRQKAARAMKTLSSNERETVINHLYADLTFREIAKVRGVSINTAWSWYRRAMAKLRGALEQDL